MDNDILRWCFSVTSAEQANFPIGAFTVHSERKIINPSTIWASKQLSNHDNAIIFEISPCIFNDLDERFPRGIPSKRLCHVPWAFDNIKAIAVGAIHFM
jgi:hypothetical protein